MRSARPFLTARWSNLGIITYACDPRLLHPHVPPRCELDRREGLGDAFVSLVAFDFLDTRVRGICCPGHVNFPEINLRTYVRNGQRRGVVFIRELVPRWLVASVARRIYNEPYQTAPMRSRVSETDDFLEIEHAAFINGREDTIRVRGGKPSFVPAQTSVEHFFKEHQWGFGTSRDGRLITYEVRHPLWRICRDVTAQLDWDFSGIYGQKWGALNRSPPISVVLAAGSAVEIWPKMSKPSSESHDNPDNPLDNAPATH